MHATHGCKRAIQIILLNLISSRSSTDSPRHGATNCSNVDSLLKMHCDNRCDVTIANPCKGILSMTYYTLVMGNYKKTPSPGTIYWMLNNNRMVFIRNNNGISFCRGIITPTHRIFLAKLLQMLQNTVRGLH